MPTVPTSEHSASEPLCATVARSTIPNSSISSINVPVPDAGDVAALEEWLDLRGIPRVDPPDVWGETKQLALSDRVLRLYRVATTSEYSRGVEFGTLTRLQGVEDARRSAVMECAIWLYRRKRHRYANELVVHAGYAEEDLARAVRELDDDAPNDDDDCYGRIGCPCHDFRK